MVDYKIEDIKIFVDGVEIESPQEGSGITPEEDDKVSHIKDWTKKSVAKAKTLQNDGNGSIVLVPTSASNGFLGGLAKSLKNVTVVFASENPDATVWKKISLDNCTFQNPEVKPTAEGEALDWKFKGYNFDIDWS